MSVYLRTKFQVSSIVLTSFRQDVILPLPPTSEQTPQKPIQIRVKQFQQRSISDISLLSILQAFEAEFDNRSNPK